MNNLKQKRANTVSLRELKRFLHDFESPLSLLKVLSRIENAGESEASLALNTLKELRKYIDTITKQTIIQEEMIDIVALTSSIINKYNITKPDVHISLQNSTSNKSTIFMNSTELIRVFQNLINNSIDSLASSEDKQIRIELNEDENDYIITFFDNGSGIDSGTVSNLNSGISVSTKAKGQGIGFFESKSWVESNGGLLLADSVKYQGARIILILPKGKD